MKMSKMNRTVINMAAAIFTYLLLLAVSFFLSPFIVKNIGVEANGYITLGNNFVMYATLLTAALTSMSGRFITIELEKNNYEKANVYYNSVLAGSTVICFFITLVSVFCILFLEKLIKIPEQLIFDIKLLFAFLMLNFIISVYSSVFSVATFATNKLYLYNLRYAEGTLLRALMLYILFSFFTPRIYYVGFAAFTVTLYLAFFNLYYRRSLLKDITLKKCYIKVKAIWELITSGIWNTVTQLGQILLSGLDILIANIFINPVAMGVLSISKTIPSAVTGIVETMTTIFVPELTISFAHGDMDEMARRAKQSMKIVSTFINIPIVIMAINADQFYSLWQPTQDAKYLHTLTILTMMFTLINGGVNILYKVFVVVNRLKTISILIVLSGVISAGSIFILLKTTDLGLYVIAFTSEFVGLIRTLFFVVPWGAKYLNQKWYTFYPEAFKPLIPSAICIALGYLVKDFFVVDNWLSYIASSLVIAVVVLLLNLFIILNKNDRIFLKSLLIKRLKKS